MFELVALLSFVCSGIIIYFIQKKRAENKRVKNQFTPTRQKDIKKAMKKAMKKARNESKT
ncbi:hypothetical protein [Halarcobacter sp.]|uniref:hypothetical protein n=1 Tax=Halarcobacter sp. TaxID=2321133 RepID=UPI0029F5BE5F|nr:hypothetical protein [Halarcobacter sp.]